MDPWDVELVVVRGLQRDGGERSALSRDAARSILTPIRSGVYVPTAEWTGLDPESQHIVRIRALAASSADEPVFSHWSAAVLHGLPDYREHLARVHVTVASQEERTRTGTFGHVFPVQEQEVVRVHGLLATSLGRTVVDLAGTRQFAQGLAVADGALSSGVPRELLEAAADLAGPRRAGARIADVLAFAHPGAESVLESEGRRSMFLLGVEPQQLQHRVSDGAGFEAFVDTWSPRIRVAGEADGAAKILDPALAKDGPARAFYEEKRREDRLRRHVAGLARWGAREAGNPALLRPILAAAGLRPERRPPTLQDWAIEARAARPRRPWRRVPSRS